MRAASGKVGFGGDEDDSSAELPVGPPPASAAGLLQKESWLPPSESERSYIDKLVSEMANFDGDKFTDLVSQLVAEHYRLVSVTPRKPGPAGATNRCPPLEPLRVEEGSVRKMVDEVGVSEEEEFSVSRSMSSALRPPERAASIQESEQADPVGFEQSVIMKEIKNKIVGDTQKRERRPSGLARQYALARGWITPQELELGLAARKGILARIVESKLFEFGCMFIIALNAVLLGVGIDYSARNNGTDELPVSLEALGWTCTCWFVLEILLRVVAEGLAMFFLSSPNRRWNRFDLVVVLMDVGEKTAVMVAGRSQNDNIPSVSLLRIVRLAKLLKAFQVIRIIRFCKELRLMVVAIMTSGTSLLWSLVLLCVIIYVFSCYLTTTVADHLRNRIDINVDGANAERLAVSFGTMIDTGFTLLQSVLGGLSWGEVGVLLAEIHWTHATVLSFYVFFTTAVMLNIITGIFVEQATREAHKDKDEVLRTQMQEENSNLKQMERFFRDADTDKSGYITMEELESKVRDPECRALLSTMGLQVSEVAGFFQLLDVEGHGEISVEEFVYGLMRLQGGARSIDLVTLMHENARLSKKWSHYMKDIMHKLEQVHLMQMVMAETATTVRPQANRVN